MDENNLDTESTEQQTEQPEQHVEVMDELTALKTFAHKYGTSIITGTCIALVIIAGVALQKNKTTKSLESASKALTEARSSGDIEAMLEEHGATPAAPLALLRLAKTYFDAGNYDVALNRYSQFKTKYPEHDFLPIAELGEVHCIEAKYMLSEALEGFEKFIAKNPDNFLKVHAVMGKARCLKELGKTKEARQVYEDLMISNPNSRWVAMIEDILDNMDKVTDSAPDAENVQETSKEAPKPEPVVKTDAK